LVAWAGVVLVHALAVAALCLSRVPVADLERPAVTVQLIAEPARPQVPVSAPVAVRLTVRGAALSDPRVPAIEVATEPVNAPIQEGAPVIETSSRPAGPETIQGQLELQCPERRLPRYPAASRREREQGEVRMRVELDELGRVESVSVVESSGWPRLDEAAREAVLAWHCQPAQRDGRPVRAVALQTMAFVLERR